MHSRKKATIAVAAVVVILAAVIVVRADQPPQASLSPDHILKGNATIVTITDKSIPKEIKSVLIARQPGTVQEPTAEGKVSVLVPQLDFVGQADVEVIGTDDKPVAVGKLTYVESTEPPSNAVNVFTGKHLGLLFVYVGLIFLLPSICTIYDIFKSYQERHEVLTRRLQITTTDEVRALLKDMDQGPTGLTGLTRGLIALMLVLALAFATFHLVVFTPSNVPDIAEKLLILLAGTLTSITGFYFGSKAASDAQQPGGKGTNGSNAANGAQQTGGKGTSGSSTATNAQQTGGKGTDSSKAATTPTPPTPH